MEIPIGSGPYKIEKFDAGRSITYELNHNYWGKNIPIKKGTENFGSLFNMNITKIDQLNEKLLNQEI